MTASAPPQVSLVIVAFDMARQIERTIQSLSPPLQTGIEAGEYELIVVDNGSRQPIDRERCEAFGAQLRWIRIEDAPASPAKALNRGIAAARAPLVGAMVDGARMASPGLLEHALIGSRTYGRAIVATLGFHLGHEPQQQAIQAGYDEAAEARLLERVGWEEDGYRLFEVSVPAISSSGGWLVVPAESNALFMLAEMWAELGGFDEGFGSPGGGLVNHDLFVRACELPRSELLMLLGEATFHQVHGGISTNELAVRMDDLYAEYEALRGRAFQRPTRQPLFLGRLRSSALEAFARSVRVPRSSSGDSAPAAEAR